MLWGKIASIYDIFAYIINRKTHDILCKKIVDYIDKTDSVLECACGTGLLTVSIAEKCHFIVATDFSLNMLKKTQRKCLKYGNVRIEQADIMNLETACEKPQVLQPWDESTLLLCFKYT